MTARPTFPLPFRRASGHGKSKPERLRFQVVLCLTLQEQLSSEEFEEILENAICTLTEEAQGLALGPVGGVDLSTGTVEIEFTMEAISPAVLYAKMGEVMRVLEHAGFVYEGSKEHLLPEHDLQPA